MLGPGNSFCAYLGWWAPQPTYTGLPAFDYWSIALSLLLVGLLLFAHARARRLGWSARGTWIVVLVSASAIGAVQLYGRWQDVPAGLLTPVGAVQWPLVFFLVLSLFYFRVMRLRKLRGEPGPPPRTLRERLPTSRFGRHVLRALRSASPALVRRCPRCSGYAVRRSTRVGAIEKVLLPLLLLRPYRCVQCDTRYNGLFFALRVRRHKAARAPKAGQG